MKYSAIFKSIALATVCMASIPTHGMGWLFRSCRTKRQESEPEQVATTPRDAISLEHRSCRPKRQEQAQVIPLPDFILCSTTNNQDSLVRQYDRNENIHTTSQRNKNAMYHYNQWGRRRRDRILHIAEPEEHAKVDTIEQELMSPLPTFARHNPISLAQFILQHGGDALHLTASRGEADVMNYQLKLVNKEDRLALLNTRRNPLYYGETPLHIAVDKGFVDTARAIIESVNKKDRMVLLDTRRNLLNNDETPLHIAVDKGFVDTARVIIGSVTGDDRNAILEARNKRQDTPLHIAVDKEFVDIVRVIIESVTGNDRNALFDACTPWQGTPLERAIERGSIHTVQLLLTAGASPNNYTRGSRSSLHEAVSSQHTDIAELLIRHGADPECIYNNVTPLQIAVLEDNVWMRPNHTIATVRRLMQLGATIGSASKTTASWAWALQS